MDTSAADSVVNDPWSGVICTQCGDEVYRILEGRCFRCVRGDNLEAVEDIEYKAMRPSLQGEARRHGLWVWPKKRKKSASGRNRG